MSDVFFFGNGAVLYCDDVERDGSVIKGYVVNGAWEMRYDTRDHIMRCDDDVVGHSATLMHEV